MRNHTKVAIMIFILMMYTYCTYVKTLLESVPGAFETIFIIVLIGSVVVSVILSDAIITTIFRHYYKKFLTKYEQRQHLYFYADTPGFHEKIHNVFMNMSLLDSRSEYVGGFGRLKLRADLIMPLRRAVANIDILNKIDHKKLVDSTNILPTDFFTVGVKDKLNEMLPTPPQLAELKEVQVDSIQNHLDEDLMEKVK